MSAGDTVRYPSEGLQDRGTYSLTCGEYRLQTPHCQRCLERPRKQASAQGHISQEQHEGRKAQFPPHKPGQPGRATLASELPKESFEAFVVSAHSLNPASLPSFCKGVDSKNTG